MLFDGSFTPAFAWVNAGSSHFKIFPRKIPASVSPVKFSGAVTPNLLGEAVDRAGADLVVHGHAHAGSERGTTPGGVAVRNVAMPVIGTAYRVYCLGGADECADDSQRVARVS